MDSLGKILKSRVKEIGLGRQAGAMEVLRLAQEYIDGSFSSALAGRLAPASFKNKVLAISCSGSSAASDLKFHEKSFVDFINLKLHCEAIEKIRILIT
ncbi:MAG: DciA family protein [Patescibacteria group bacterium]